jgi:putative ABC transport system substrate-binding protein
MLLNRIIFILLIFLAILPGCRPAPAGSVTIGIIEPLEHKAMTEIVAGFSDTLTSIYHKPVIIKIENAQNDPNLQRAIIQKMRAANYAMIIPIGVAATQMTLSMAHEKPVVSLASDLSQTDRVAFPPCHAAIVHDEIPVQQLLAFIHAAYPTLTHLTLIHSAADKVFPQVKAAIAAGKKYGITVTDMMVATLPELYSVMQSIPSNTQGIFILKDNLIVSGIGTLAKTAALKHIPLITSDQGSVQDGAGFALGVHEREIGVAGAKLAAAVLNGQSICDLHIVEMDKLTVFINASALPDQTAVLNAAKQLNYQTEIVGTGKIS